MANRKLSRRDVLRGAAAGSAGLLIGGQGFPAFGQEKAPELDLPQGAAGKLTVIHRTEYFEAAQTAFRDTVTEFAAANNVELDISTTNPESFGDFMGKMTAAVQGRQSAGLRLHQQRFHPADAPARPRRGRDRRGRRGGQQVRQHHAGPQRRQDRPVRRRAGRPIPLIGTTTGYYIRGDKLKEQGIDPATSARPSATVARRR